MPKLNKLETISHLVLFCLFSLFLTACASSNLPVAVPDEAPPVTKTVKDPQVALVLGSGGARGYAHLGVLQALEEAGIKVDLLAGCSAGSVIAALYADNGSAKYTEDIMLKAGFWDFTELNNVGAIGVIKGTSFEKFMLQHMQAQNFAQLKTKLLVATTDINSGATYIIQSGPIIPALLASAAIPGFIAPLHLYSHTLIDGGVSDPVPVNLVKPFHPKVIVAVNLNPMTSRDTPTTALGVSHRAFLIMLRHITKDSLQGADVVISPKVGNSTFDTSHRDAIYKAGLEAGRRAVPKIKRLLAARSHFG